MFRLHSSKGVRRDDNRQSRPFAIAVFSFFAPDDCYGVIFLDLKVAEAETLFGKTPKGG